MKKQNPGLFAQGTVFFVAPTGLHGFPRISFSRTKNAHTGHAILATWPPRTKNGYTGCRFWASGVPFFSDLHKVELWLSWGAGFCYPTVFFVAPTGLRCSSPKAIYLKTKGPVYGVPSLTGIFAAGHIYIYIYIY